MLIWLRILRRLRILFASRVTTVNMDIVKIILVICCAAALALSDGNPGIAENLQWLKAKIQQLEQKEHELERMSMELKEENRRLADQLGRMESMRDSFVGFDCFRSEDWLEAATITYDGCSVDTTGGNPASGNFVVGEQGPYRVVHLDFTEKFCKLLVMSRGWQREENPSIEPAAEQLSCSL